MFFFSAGDELSVYLDAKECYYCFNNNYENKTKKKGLILKYYLATVGLNKLMINYSDIK